MEGVFQMSNEKYNDICKKYSVDSLVIFPMVESVTAVYGGPINFLGNVLPSSERDGCFFLSENATFLSRADNSLFLFQYKKGQERTSIVGCGICESHGEKAHPDEGIVQKYYRFVPETIKVFDNSISLKELQSVSPDIKLSRAQYVDFKYKSAICSLIDTRLNISKSFSKNINIALAPKHIETMGDETYYTCGNCEFRFKKAPRCPECGQLVLEQDLKG